MYNIILLFNIRMRISQTMGDVIEYVFEYVSKDITFDRNVETLQSVILVFLLLPDSVPDHVEGGGGSPGPLGQPGFQLHHQQYLWRERGECWQVLLYIKLCCSPLCITEQSLISLPIL